MTATAYESRCWDLTSTVTFASFKPIFPTLGSYKYNEGMKAPMDKCADRSQKAFSVYNGAPCFFAAGNRAGMGRTRTPFSLSALPLGPGGGFHLS